MLKLHAFKLLFCVIHGPDFAYSKECVNGFWDDAFFDFAACFVPGDSVTVFVDGDCRITDRDGPEDIYVGNVLDPSHRHTYVTDVVVQFCR